MTLAKATPADSSARDEWRRNWPVVLAGAAGVTLASLPGYTMGVMIGPLEAEFGWSRAAISSGLMIPATAAVIMGPFIGLAVDRWGPRRIALIGTVIAPISIGLLSTVMSAIWTWWALWSFVALAAMFVKPMVWTAGVSSSFSTSRGLALAVTLCGIALSSSITPVLTNWIVDHHGWRTGYVGLAAFWAAIALPLVWLLFKTRADAGRRAGPVISEIAQSALPGVSAREGLTSWRYVRLAVAATIMVLAAVALSGNLIPILISSGFVRARAAEIAGLIGLATLTGRLVGGYLLDRLNGNLVAAASTCLPIAATLIILAFPGELPAAICATLILGFAIGAEIDAIAYLTTRHFGIRSFGVLYGTIGGLTALSSGLGPLIMNHVYDVTGAYRAAMWLLVPLGLTAAALFLSLGRYRDFTPEDAPLTRVETP